MSAELAAQESSKNDIHDLFVRALAVPKPEKKRKDWNKPLETWPKYALAWDSESRITVDQSLTFGVYRLLRLIDGIYAVIEEGIFYADDLPKKERKELESHIRSATSDVTSFPPRFPLYSRSEFMQKVFWPAITNRGAMVVGFNLPYDISRCAVTWSKGEDDEWSLTMSQYPDGNENRNYPRILIKPIDKKKAFIRLATPWKTSEWKNNGQARFIDLRTLLWALYNRSFSLKRACDNDDGPFKGQNL